jgi:hypothetical protein
LESGSLLSALAGLYRNSLGPFFSPNGRQEIGINVVTGNGQLLLALAPCVAPTGARASWSARFPPLAQWATVWRPSGTSGGKNWRAVLLDEIEFSGFFHFLAMWGGIPEE